MPIISETLEKRVLLASFSPPIVITRGGTYTGRWQSLDPSTPAVRIATDQPVIIENAVIRSRGNLIQSDTPHAKITIRATRGYGLNPNVWHQAPGRFLAADSADNIVVSGNLLEGTAGIYIYGYAGDHSSNETIKILDNTARNIDGRKSNAADGFFDFNHRWRRRGANRTVQRGYAEVQFLQLDQVHGVGGIEIARNAVINEPGMSRVEDNISIYKSSGIRSSPILIHDNYIDGAYTVRPGEPNRANKKWRFDNGYSGGGIMLGDGKGRTAAEDPGFVRAYNNTVLNTSNFGVAVAAGHDIQISGNTVKSEGKLSDGTSVYAQNVGIYIWDLYKAGRSRFYNNSGSGNTIRWIKIDARNDSWTPDATSFSNNRIA